MLLDESPNLYCFPSENEYLGLPGLKDPLTRGPLVLPQSAAYMQIS